MQLTENSKQLPCDWDGALNRTKKHGWVHNPPVAIFRLSDKVASFFFLSQYTSASFDQRLLVILFFVTCCA